MKIPIKVIKKIEIITNNNNKLNLLKDDLFL